MSLFSKDSKLLIHPCYWLALNLNQTTLTPEFADDIYDEYDIEIEIDSINQEERKNKIGRIMEEIKSISPGREHAHNFEDWCLQAIRLVFAGSLSNIQLHDNKSGVQQRDIIATNTSHKGVWKNIYDDYRTRQVIFEVKNFSGLAIKEYRQVNSYLCNEYGNLAFIICRDTDNNLTSGKDLDAAKEIYHNHKKLIIKISERFLVKHLSKLRSPQKHDAANKEIEKLIDPYIRTYLPIKSSL